MTDTYYVKAQLDNLTGRFVHCQYFLDPAGTKPAKVPLAVSKTAGACNLVLIQTTDLVLVSSTYKTLGHAPVLLPSNFTPAVDNKLAIPMPTDQVVTKGAVLMFANSGQVESLYPSADPQIINDNA